MRRRRSRFPLPWRMVSPLGRPVNRVGITSRPQSGDTYGAGERITVRVGFTTPIEVTGSPQVELTGRERYAPSNLERRRLDVLLRGLLNVALRLRCAGGGLGPGRDQHRT